MMTESELAESIYWEAEQYIPFDIQDVNLDYQILDKGGEPRQGDDGRAPRRGEEGEDRRLHRRHRAGGAQPRSSSTSTPSRCRTPTRSNYGIESGAVVVLLNAGASATNINILNGDQSVFTRDISIGGNAYTEALQKELNLPFDLADQLKRGMPVDGVTFDDARPVLRAVSENVMLEIQKTFDFFKATAASDRIDRIMLSGGASRAEGFTEMLTERFEAPVEGLDPFKRVGFDMKKFQVDSAGGRRADRGSRRRPRAAAGGRPMIRINLLAVDRERTKRSGALIPAAHRVTIAASLILIAHRRWASGGGSGRCGRRPAASTTTSRRGRSRRSSCARCSRRCRSSRRARRSFSSASRSSSSCAAARRGPVHVLDEISKAIPDRLWLTEMTQKGDDFAHFAV